MAALPTYTKGRSRTRTYDVLGGDNLPDVLAAIEVDLAAKATAEQGAKADTAVQPDQLKTLNGESLIGGGDISTATNLDYDHALRLLTSSTGADVELPLFTATEAGLVPASGGGTDGFLRKDGAWAAPAGSGSQVLTWLGLD